PAAGPVSAALAPSLASATWVRLPACDRDFWADASSVEPEMLLTSSPDAAAGMRAIIPWAEPALAEPPPGDSDAPTAGAGSLPMMEPSGRTDTTLTFLGSGNPLLPSAGGCGAGARLTTAGVLTGGAATGGMVADGADCASANAA